MPAQEYLRRILTARVYDVAIESPLERGAARCRERLGNRVLLKREDLQPVRSFKLRGAYNKMAQLPRRAAQARRHRGVGGQPCAGRRAGRPEARLPRGDRDAGDHAAGEGRRGAGARGATVVLFGDSYSDAYAHALELQKRRKLTFVHPFDDPDVIAGQGTIAMEILRQHHPDDDGPIHAVFVAIGGGGLISGVAAYIKALAPGHQGHRRADDRFGRDGAFARRGPPRSAARRRALFGRHRGEDGRRGDAAPVPPVCRRDRAGRHRRHLRRHQGRVPGHPLDPRARGRAFDRRHEELRAPRKAQGQDAGRDRLRREHELRSPALRRGTDRSRRGDERRCSR